MKTIAESVLCRLDRGDKNLRANMVMSSGDYTVYPDSVHVSGNNAFMIVRNSEKRNLHPTPQKFLPDFQMKKLSFSTAEQPLFANLMRQTPKHCVHFFRGVLPKACASSVPRWDAETASVLPPADTFRLAKNMPFLPCLPSSQCVS